MLEYFIIIIYTIIKYCSNCNNQGYYCIDF